MDFGNSYHACVSRRNVLAAIAGGSGGIPHDQLQQSQKHKLFNDIISSEMIRNLWPIIGPGRQTINSAILTNEERFDFGNRT